MGQVSATLRSTEDGLLFWCPGCCEVHQVRTLGATAVWGFNGNVDRPTFTPSVLVTSGHYTTGQEGKACWCSYEERFGRKAPFACHRCHSFVTDGQIQFLGDCSHSLAGQTVPLPELPAHLRDQPVDEP